MCELDHGVRVDFRGSRILGRNVIVNFGASVRARVKKTHEAGAELKTLDSTLH